MVMITLPAGLVLSGVVLALIVGFVVGLLWRERRWERRPAVIPAAPLSIPTERYEQARKNADWWAREIAEGRVADENVKAMLKDLQRALGRT